MAKKHNPAEERVALELELWSRAVEGPVTISDLKDFKNVYEKKLDGKSIQDFTQLRDRDNAGIDIIVASGNPIEMDEFAIGYRCLAEGAIYAGRPNINSSGEFIEIGCSACSRVLYKEKVT